LKQGLQYILFIFLLGFPFTHIYADSTNTNINTPLTIAQKMCGSQTGIHILERLYIIDIAKSASSDNLSEIKDFRGALFSDYDSLEVLFQCAVKNPQLDFFYEADKHAWFLYCQDFLHQRGINLSANDRFNYVDLLPKEGNATVKLKRGISDTVLTHYFIDSAAYTIIDRYYPNWKNSPVERIQKLDV
jgi:hypothetical protein